MITRAALKGNELEVFDSKLTAVGFGFLVPFFFVTSGMNFDLDALGSSSALLKLPLFLGLFVVVRGTPAVLLYRGVLDARERAALAVFSATELPLVVAITTLATEGGHMRTSTAAALVGAAILSTLIFPFVGLALRRGADAEKPRRPAAGSGRLGRVVLTPLPGIVRAPSPARGVTAISSRWATGDDWRYGWKPMTRNSDRST